MHFFFWIKIASSFILHPSSLSSNRLFSFIARCLLILICMYKQSHSHDYCTVFFSFFIIVSLLRLNRQREREIKMKITIEITVTKMNEVTIIIIIIMIIIHRTYTNTNAWMNIIERMKRGFLCASEIFPYSFYYCRVSIWLRSERGWWLRVKQRQSEWQYSMRKRERWNIKNIKMYEWVEWAFKTQCLCVCVE